LRAAHIIEILALLTGSVSDSMAMDRFFLGTKAVDRGAQAKQFLCLAARKHADNAVGRRKIVL
jgi:hypothetical protein